MKALDLPSSLEFIGRACFGGVQDIAQFSFGLPSHLQDLEDLPIPWDGSRVIPGSVEVIEIAELPKYMRGDLSRLVPLLVFDRDSGLRQIRRSGPRSRGFVRATNRSLKVIRSDLEFQPLEIAPSNAQYR
jgi:hypothetical protein